MRLPCPICGTRDVREFYYQGSAVMLERPSADAGQAAWDDYLHLRDNQPGNHEELWSHDAGCGAWLKVVRNTANHVVHSAVLAKGIKR